MLSILVSITAHPSRFFWTRPGKTFNWHFTFFFSSRTRLPKQAKVVMEWEKLGLRKAFQIKN
jgi:hypothetical protein